MHNTFELGTRSWAGHVVRLFGWWWVELGHGLKHLWHLQAYRQHHTQVGPHLLWGCECGKVFGKSEFFTPEDVVELSAEDTWRGFDRLVVLRARLDAEGRK